MKKFSTLVAGLALAMAFAPINASFADAPSGASGMATVDHSISASKLIGMTVYNDRGTSIGKVEDILVANGSVEPSAILSVGDFVDDGHKMVRVKLSHIHLAADKLAMPTATKEHLAAMPSYNFLGLNGGGG